MHLRHFCTKEIITTLRRVTKKVFTAGFSRILRSVGLIQIIPWIIPILLRLYALNNYFILSKFVKYLFNVKMTQVTDI